MLGHERFLVQNQKSKKAGHALAVRIDELREILRNSPPFQLAEFTGADYSELGPGRGEFRLSLWNSKILITYPLFDAYDLHDDLLPIPLQALLMYYFVTANGAPLTGKWDSFADLPDGRMYGQAFQGYSGDEIIRNYGGDIDAFQKACKLAGGQKIKLADAAYIIQGLPRVPLLLTYWLGDEEFPSTCKILFDSAACNYLPIDACAILGSMLARRIVTAQQELNL
jgi:hypothetical protein